MNVSSAARAARVLVVLAALVVAPLFSFNATPASAYVPSQTRGLWLLGGDGGVFTRGEAQFYGSTGAMVLNQPVVGIASTVTGKGYWLVAADGGIFAFGDANFYGSTGAIRLNQPIVGMATTPSGRGYWLVARDGGIFAFGDATFYGSTGNITLNQPIVGMAAVSTGGGYYFVAADGGVFSFGPGARFHGSAVNMTRNGLVTGMATTTSNNDGYWLVTSGGDTFGFGAAATQARSLDAVVAVTAMAEGGVLKATADGRYFAAGGSPSVSGLSRGGSITNLNAAIVGMAVPGTVEQGSEGDPNGVNSPASPAPAQPAPTMPDAPLFFANCSDANGRGYYNIRNGEPGYRPALDGDRDGIACES